jgi:hypothetical protein
MIPVPDPEAFHGRSVPLAAPSAAEPPTATRPSEDTTEIKNFRMMSLLLHAARRVVALVLPCLLGTRLLG